MSDRMLYVAGVLGCTAILAYCLFKQAKHFERVYYRSRQASSVNVWQDPNWDPETGRFRDGGKAGPRRVDESSHLNHAHADSLLSRDGELENREMAKVALPSAQEFNKGLPDKCRVVLDNSNRVYRIMYVGVELDAIPYDEVNKWLEGPKPEPLKVMRSAVRFRAVKAGKIPHPSTESSSSTAKRAVDDDTPAG